MVRPWKERSKQTYSKRPGLVPDAPRELHGPFPRLGPRVAEEDLRGEGEGDQALGERARGLGVEQVARVDELARLLADGLDDRAVAVAEAVHRDARREVEVGSGRRLSKSRAPLPETRTRSRS